jgi:hypothetical protein
MAGGTTDEIELALMGQLPSDQVLTSLHLFYLNVSVRKHEIQISLTTPGVSVNP